MISYESANLLAAVSVALMSDTSVALTAQMLPEGHALRSATYLDAVESVKKIIDLRARVSALEAERDKAVELLRRWGNTKWDETFGVHDVTLEGETESFLASIGGEK